MEYGWMPLLFLCPLLFFSGLVDAISGGGGLISLPVFLFTGLPTHIAYASNKITCTATTVFTTGFYYKNKAMDVRNALIATAAAMVSAAVAAQVMLRLSETVLDYMFTIALPLVALFIIFRRGEKKTEEGQEVQLPTGRRAVLLAILVGLITGVYDGFIGPGSGTLCILLFASLLHTDLLHASGNSRMILLGATGVSSITYFFAGNIYWFYTIPAILSSLLGSLIGARFALSRGAKAIRPMMIVIAVLLLVKLAVETIT